MTRVILDKSREIGSRAEAEFSGDHLEGQGRVFDLGAGGVKGALRENVGGCEIGNLLADAREMGWRNAEILRIGGHRFSAGMIARYLGAEGAHEAQRGGGARFGWRIEKVAAEPDRQKRCVATSGFFSEGSAELEFARHVFEAARDFVLRLHLPDAEKAVIGWKAEAVPGRQRQGEDVTLFA